MSLVSSFHLCICGALLLRVILGLDVPLWLFFRAYSASNFHGMAMVVVAFVSAATASKIAAEQSLSLYSPVQNYKLF